MNDNGYCTVCKRNCHWSKHKNKLFFIVITNIAKETYNAAKRQKSEAENDIKSFKREIEEIKSEIDAEGRKLVILLGC